MSAVAAEYIRIRYAQDVRNSSQLNMHTPYGLTIGGIFERTDFKFQKFKFKNLLV